MSRSLIIPKPTSAQRRQLLRLLDNTDDPQVRRKAEAVWLDALGFNVQDIARALEMHPGSIYAHLHAFEQDGLTAVQHVQRGGAKPRITPQQVKTLCGLAQQSPHERG
jgi:transposase